VWVSFGNLINKKSEFPAIIPAGKVFTNGASLFEFHAFDSTLPIHLLFNDIAVLSGHLESVVRESADAEIERLKSEGAETANLLIQPTSFIATARFTFGEIASDAPLTAPSDQSESPPMPGTAVTA
jgi:hypothetical protein